MIRWRPAATTTVVAGLFVACSEPALDLSKRTMIVEVPYTVGIYEENCDSWCAKHRRDDEQLHFCETLHRGDASFTSTAWSWALCSFEVDE